MLDFQDKIVIKGRAWVIQEFDAISTPGLVYYSLKPTTISKESVINNNGKDIYVEKHNTITPTIIDSPVMSLDMDRDEILVSPNKELIVFTENGYFVSSNKNIKIHKRNATQVIFSIPFGIETLDIEFKEKGDIVSKTYRVV